MTKRLRISLITAVALGALASPAAGFAQNNLIATVGTNDSQVITLTHENGAPVNDIPAGTYTIEVRDRSTMHNFHLTGPGVDRETAVGSIQTVTWTVTFENEARYVFVCDPHSTTMRGSFTTGGDRLRRRLRRLHQRWERRCTRPSAPASRSRSERSAVRGSGGSGPGGTRSSCAIAPRRTTSTSTGAA
jgi:plastocyanin